jgi:Plavaka transposase
MDHQDAIAKDRATHGAMFVPIIAGSDKTTVSVATGNQEYHPVYMSPGNLSNIARRAHTNAFLPIAFLPIPKSEYTFRSCLLNELD